MTDQEFKQEIATAPANKVIPLLQEAETALNAVYPFAKRYTELEAAKGKAEQDRDGNDVGLQKSTLVIFLVMAAVAFVIGISTKKILLSLLVWFLFIALLTCIPFQLVKINNAKRDFQKASEQAIQLTSQLAVAEAQLRQVKAQYQNGLLLRKTIMPAECIEPRYMRQFISYLEDGRASNLNEARSLFDEYVHRERMESMAGSQVQAAQAAEQAAYAARQASQQAAANASSAEASADWASYQARYHSK